VLQEIARPERFAALERQVLDLSLADGRDSGTPSMGIGEDLIAPPDQRFTREFDYIATSTNLRMDGSANLYVITNLDIAASYLPQAELALHNLATAERQINGNRGVEILRQANHATISMASRSVFVARGEAADAGAGAAAPTAGMNKMANMANCFKTFLLSNANAEAGVVRGKRWSV
jgi:hypothetical protein